MARSNSSGPLELVAVDLGGTHIRFCTALVSGRTVLELRGKQVFRTADFPSFGAAASAYRAACGGELPKVAALAVACPVKGEILPLTNLDWRLVRSEIGAQMGMDEILILNDFVAQSHAVANLPAEAFERIGGPAPQLPLPGLITIVGPGPALVWGMCFSSKRDTTYWRAKADISVSLRRMSWKTGCSGVSGRSSGASRQNG